MIWILQGHKIRVEGVLFKISGRYTDLRLSSILYTFEVFFTIYLLYVIFPIFKTGRKLHTKIFFICLFEPN